MITPLLLLAILVVIPFLPATTPIGTTTTMDPRTSSKYMQIPALVQDLQIYQGFTFITFGIQFWEHLLTFRFELDVYTRRLPWRHGMIAYIIIRYSTWASLIPTLINICSLRQVDCQAALNAILVPLSTAIIMTSLIFIIRCIAVWEKNVWVTILLGSLWLAEAVMQLTSPFRMRSEWIRGACQTWFTSQVWKFNFAYLLAECTDIVTFALAAWKLRDMRTMGLGKVLFQQSVIYIGISTALNTVCLTLIYLDLSPVLSYLCSPFAMTISGILACRAFRDLQLAAHRGSPDLCFIKSNGILWGTRDVNPGGPNGIPHGQTVGNPHHIEPDDEGYNAHEIVNGCPEHGRQSTPRRGHLLSGSIDAATGRRLGIRPSKEDWVTRSGLGDPIYRHRQSQQFQPTPSELPLPATSTAGLDVGISSTQTTFLGFLLGEEQAAFDSARAQQQQQVQRSPSSHKMNLIVDCSSRSGTTHEKSDKDTTSDADLINTPRCMRYESDDQLASRREEKWSTIGTPTTLAPTISTPTSGGGGGGMFSKLAKYSLPSFDNVARDRQFKDKERIGRRLPCHSDPPSPQSTTASPGTTTESASPKVLSERQRQRQRRVGLHSGDGRVEDHHHHRGMIGGENVRDDELHDSATSFLSFPEAEFEDVTGGQLQLNTTIDERATSPLSINTVRSGTTPTSPCPTYLLDPTQHQIARPLPSLPPPPRHHNQLHGSPSRKSNQQLMQHTTITTKTSTASRPCTADGASDIVLHEPSHAAQGH